MEKECRLAENSLYRQIIIIKTSIGRVLNGNKSISSIRAGSFVLWLYWLGKQEENEKKRRVVKGREKKTGLGDMEQ